MITRSELDTGNQSVFAFGKKPLQIFILIDLMMLMVFMLMSQPTSDLVGDIMVDDSNGYVAGTKISLHDEFGYRIGAFLSLGNALRPIDESELTSHLNGFDCTDGPCIDHLPKDLHFSQARIYLPDEVMTLAYSMISTFCRELQCDRNIYIRADTGEVLLCSEKHQRFFSYDKLDGSLLEDEPCQPARK